MTAFDVLRNAGGAILVIAALLPTMLGILSESPRDPAYLHRGGNRAFSWASSRSSTNIIASARESPDERDPGSLGATIRKLTLDDAEALRRLPNIEASCPRRRDGARRYKEARRKRRCRRG